MRSATADICRLCTSVEGDRSPHEERSWAWTKEGKFNPDDASVGGSVNGMPRAIVQRDGAGCLLCAPSRPALGAE